MRRALLTLALLAVLAPPAAAAKEITAVALCGPDGCSDVTVRAGLHEFPGGGSSSSGPPPAAPFLVVKLEFDGMHTERLWYVPASRMFAHDGGAVVMRWLPAGAHELDRAIVAAAPRVEPYRPRAVTAFVGDRRVEGDVSGYLDLFAVESTGPARFGSGGYEPVSVKTDPPSPWARTTLFFHPREGLLERGPELIRLPGGIAADLRAARPVDLDAPASGFDWPLVTGSLAIALAAALTAVLLVRRGRAPRPGTA